MKADKIIILLRKQTYLLQYNLSVLNISSVKYISRNNGIEQTTQPRLCASVAQDITLPIFQHINDIYIAYVEQKLLNLDISSNQDDDYYIPCNLADIIAILGMTIPLHIIPTLSDVFTPDTPDKVNQEQ